MPGRCWASVKVPVGQEDGLPYKAYDGFPDGRRQPLPVPDVLLIDEQPDGFFLLGYKSNGEFSGDTWHPDLDEAKGQAEFAYGDYLGEWKAIPDGTEDAVRYALDQREDE